MSKISLILGLFAFMAIGAGGENLELTDDAQGALKIHNDARAEVGIAPLIWSTELSKQAQDYARRLAKMGKLVHSKSTSDGENLYWCSWEADAPFTQASQSWYDEVNVYRYRKCCGPNWIKTGHYTQMIWESTTAVGMGMAVSSNGETYVVARYNPPGNYVGKYPYRK